MGCTPHTGTLFHRVSLRTRRKVFAYGIRVRAATLRGSSRHWSSKFSLIALLVTPTRLRERDSYLNKKVWLPNGQKQTQTQTQTRLQPRRCACLCRHDRCGQTYPLEFGVEVSSRAHLLVAKAVATVAAAATITVSCSNKMHHKGDDKHARAHTSNNEPPTPTLAKQNTGGHVVDLRPIGSRYVQGRAAATTRACKSQRCHQTRKVIVIYLRTNY